MKKNRLKSKNFVDIRDDDLDDIVGQLLIDFPNAGTYSIIFEMILSCFILFTLLTCLSMLMYLGHKMMEGLYRLKGPRVSRSQLRESLHRVRIRRNHPFRRAIKRRVYSLYGPLSVWDVEPIDTINLKSYFNFFKLRNCTFWLLKFFFTLVSAKTIPKTIDHLRFFIFFSLPFKYGDFPSEFGNFLPIPLTIYYTIISSRSDKGLENIGIGDFMFIARPYIESLLWWENQFIIKELKDFGRTSSKLVLSHST